MPPGLIFEIGHQNPVLVVIRFITVMASLVVDPLGTLLVIGGITEGIAASYSFAYCPIKHVAAVHQGMIMDFASLAILIIISREFTAAVTNFNWEIAVVA